MGAAAEGQVAVDVGILLHTLQRLKHLRVPGRGLELLMPMDLSLIHI